MSRIRQVILAIAALSLLAAGTLVLSGKTLPGFALDRDEDAVAQPLTSQMVVERKSIPKAKLSVVDGNRGIRSDNSILPANTVVFEREKNSTSLGRADSTSADPFGLIVQADTHTLESEYLSPFSETSSADTENPLGRGVTTSSNLTDNLLEVALSDPDAASAKRATVDFSLTPARGIHLLPVPATTALSTVVYAHITTDEQCLSCILKWEHLESENLQFLALENLSPEKVVTIFVTPQDGWQPGTYELSVYESAESALFLGRGAVIISGINANQPTMVPPVEFVQSLLDNGLAYPKQPLN